MTIENADVIDGMGVDDRTSEVVLIISDHLPWQNEADHFSLLELKIGKYLDFIQGGQLFETMKGLEGRPIRIDVIYEHEPTELAMTFFNAAAQQLQEIGIVLSYKSIPMGY